MRQAVILAGGKGTRLKERLGGLPKPLIDICGKPLLERQIELLRRFSFSKILILVNHGAEYIEQFCLSRNNWGIDIQCIDDVTPLGTAGATLAVFDKLEEEFLVVYGDTMLEINLRKFHEFHELHSDAVATLLVHPNDHPQDSDLVEIDHMNHIVEFHPYPHKKGSNHPNLVNAALYLFKRSALLPWLEKNGILDFGKDIFPAILAQKSVLVAYNSTEYIKDCGTPTRLDKVIKDFKSGRIERANLTVKQKAVFLDRDGVINKEVGHLSRAEQLELLPSVGNAIKILVDAEYRTIIITNQPVVARGDCTLVDIRDTHNKLENLLGEEGAYLDRIYFCPHHPDKGFKGEIKELKIACECRKPNIGMIEKACIEMNVDLNQSWFIGDSTVDILTASRAGLTSILVETGYAGMDQKYSSTPEFIVPNLLAAAELILDKYPRLLSFCMELTDEIGAGDFVFIGGLSRSGKSNLTTTLRHALKLNGHKVHSISLDRWIRSEADRDAGILGRYDLDAIREFISQLDARTKKLKLSIPCYDKKSRQRNDTIEEVIIEKSDVVIIEGTIALLQLDQVNNRKSHALFVEIDEKERHDRVLNEYKLRALEKEEAECIYQARQIDETPLILASANNARVKVNYTNF